MGEHKNEQPSWRRRVTGAVVFVLISWAGVAYVTTLVIDDPSERGQFGDMFGTVNALFSGLAFVGLIAAILLQRDELKLQREDLEPQRKELELTRAELAGPKEQMALQNETLRRQQFEATFFQMINNFFEYVEGMEIPRHRQAPIKSSEIIRDARQTLLWLYKKEYDIIAKQGVATDLFGTIWAKFEESDRNNFNNWGPYLRWLTAIISFVEERAMEGKEFYVHLLRDSMSNNEHVVIFFAGLSSSYSRLKENIEKHGFLKHLVDDGLISATGGPRDKHLQSAYN